MSDDSSAERREQRLFARLRGSISLSKAQAIAGLAAAFLSIGGSVYGYLKVTRPPDTGEIVTFVRDRADRPVTEATIEVLTAKEAVVTTFPASDPAGARRTLKEGTYRVRASHPRHGSETRTVQVFAGQTSELRFKLAPRAAAGPTAPLDDATRAVNEGVEGLKKIFR